MRVLDFHLHIGRREHLNPRMISFFHTLFGTGVLEFLDTLTPDALVSFLDSQGVEKAVVLAEHSPHATGIIPNSFVADFCSGSDRLIPVASLDPNSVPDTGSALEEAVGELGCKALKLYPSYAYFYPNDERLYPAYETASGLGIPVMLHTGSSVFPGSRIKYADPLLLDDVAEDFPDLNIVLCHGGRPFWYKQAEWMLLRHRNVHIDISGIPPKRLPEAFPKLDRFRDRFIFGSDWPQVPVIRDHADKLAGLSWPEELLQDVLWANGARLLHID